jgi:hypothetical protein
MLDGSNTYFSPAVNVGVFIDAARKSDKHLDSSSDVVGFVTMVTLSTGTSAGAITASVCNPVLGMCVRNLLAVLVALGCTVLLFASGVVTVLLAVSVAL